MKLIIAVFIAIFIYVFQKNLYGSFWDKGLDVAVDFHDTYLNKGEKSYITEVINNAKFLPLSILHVKFAAPLSFTFEDNDNAVLSDSYYRNDVFSVMSNMKITRRLYFTANKRGYYVIDGANVISKDFFLTKNFAKNIAHKSDIYVFPEKYDNKAFDSIFSMIIGDIENQMSLIEDPFTFRGIREYDSSYNMKRINWKATAKTDKLMVNIYNHTSLQNIRVLLNFETNNMIKTEYIDEVSISLASTACEFFLKKNLNVSIASNGTDIVTKRTGEISDGSSLKHMLSIDKYLSRMDGKSGIEGFMEIIDKEIILKRSNTTYLIISPYYKEDLLKKLDYMQKNGVGICMLVPYYNIHGFRRIRSYMYGWEVNIYET
ncbi:MAG: DUF58 domain-containing protein [Lachnospiraceae bacterium]|nr:DUF58 domain-containing protein [Lachnospiraceae bacterium]